MFLITHSIIWFSSSIPHEHESSQLKVQCAAFLEINAQYQLFPTFLVWYTAMFIRLAPHLWCSNFSIGIDFQLDVI